MDFEKKLKRLEEIVEKLEGGECGLDEASKLFEEGKTLANDCAKSLDDTKGKIVELVKDIDNLIEKTLK